MKGLTDRQQEIYEYLVEHFRENGYPPTIREIGFRFGIRSTKGVVDHLTALERKGFIKRAVGKSRALVLSHIEENFAQPGIPLVGRVAAGPLMLAEENIEERLVIDPVFLKNSDEFLLRIQGDSMIEAHITDGDLVLVRPAQDAAEGEIVVALVGDEATVKYFHLRDGEVELRPANRKMKPIQVGPEDEEFRIVGKVVGLFRQM